MGRGSTPPPRTLSTACARAWTRSSRRAPTTRRACVPRWPGRWGCCRAWMGLGTRGRRGGTWWLTGVGGCVPFVPALTGVLGGFLTAAIGLTGAAGAPLLPSTSRDRVFSSPTAPPRPFLPRRRHRLHRRRPTRPRLQLCRHGAWGGERRLSHRRWRPQHHAAAGRRCAGRRLPAAIWGPHAAQQRRRGGLSRPAYRRQRVSLPRRPVGGGGCGSSPLPTPP